MKFSINRTELANALSIVLKGVSTRSTLPVLSGILIEAAGDKIILQATDLELSIQYSVAALVEEVTRDDVVSAAAGIVCDCVYLLKGTEAAADDK